MVNPYARAIPYFLLSLVLLPLARADQVVLKNGDRVTGSIVKKDDKNLTIKTDQFGEVATPWDQIESIVVEKALNIVLRDGKAFQGTFTASGGKADVMTSQTRLSVALADIAILRDDAAQKAYERLLRPGWTELWAGTGRIGLAGTAGNSKTLTFTTVISVDRTTKTDKTALYFSAIKASGLVEGVNSDTAKAVRGGISYSHDTHSRLFFSAFNDYEYDLFQDLDFRFVIGGGFGFHAVKTERSSLDLPAGFAYNHSSFSTPLTQNSGEFYWGDEYTLKLSSSSTLTQSFRMFNNLTETGTYRVNFDLNLGTKILKWLTWNVSVSDRYLSEPAPDRKSNDFLYTTGIGITFSR